MKDKKEQREYEYGAAFSATFVSWMFFVVVIGWSLVGVISGAFNLEQSLPFFIFLVFFSFGMSLVFTYEYIKCKKKSKKKVKRRKTTSKRIKR